MIPYGIVYRDNPYALQTSVEIWQKKFGVYNIATFFKLGGISALALLAVNLLIGFIKKDTFAVYVTTTFVMLALTFILIYMIVKNTYIKQMALANTQKEDKQIVLYNDRLEFGTGYTKAVYYYSDVVYCCEKGDIITIITDTAAIPLSIQKSSVKKGDYHIFSVNLRQTMAGKYEYMGGKD